MIDDDDDVADLVRGLNVNSPGLRRGMNFQSATTAFGDPTCAACSRAQIHGGCEEHRKRADVVELPQPPAPAVFKPKTAERDLTPTQEAVMKWVEATHPGWYRAVNAGQRITLASLYRLGVLERQPWRGKNGSANTAYEYRLAPAVHT